MIDKSYSFNYLEDVEAKFKNDSFYYIKRYFIHYLEQRLYYLSNEKRKEALFKLSKLEMLETKYLNYSHKYVNARFKFLKRIYHSFCETIINEYMFTLKEFIDYTDNSHMSHYDSVWDFACTLINLIWQKKFQAIVDMQFPNKYKINRHYQLVTIE